MTDLALASEKGIAFYNFVHPDEPPAIVLPEISFKNVVCSEAVDPADPKKQTLLAMFAVSDDDELYYIRGTRPYATNKLTFVASGIPIAHNVQAVSAQFNASVNSSEIVYLSGGQNEIFHMWLDGGNIWQQERLLVKTTTGGVIKYPAYLTSVRLETDEAVSIGGDYPVVSIPTSALSATIIQITMPTENLLLLPRSRLGQRPIAHHHAKGLHFPHRQQRRHQDYHPVH